jgi:predicted Zn-dependent peptidase
VDQARDFITGDFPLRLETTGQVAAQISDLLVHELPDDFIRSYRERVREVTPDRALAAGRAVLRPQEMVVVVVGDAEEVRGPLEALDVGPVDLVSLF